MVFAMGLIGLPVATQAADDTVAVVLDFSNSMWGQVDEVAKIEIARDVFADMLQNWDANRPLGVVAYGHRSKDDCADIEVIQPVGPVDADALIGQIADLRPTGKTPLTEAVRQAADLLRYRDEPATVVLLSDGIETCNADPCAVAEELEQSGIAFTAHVIGFDVGEEDQAGLMCIAEATGGRYYTAANAADLAGALTAATKAEAPASYQTNLRAINALTGNPVTGNVSWMITDSGGKTVPAPGSGAEIVLDLLPGNFSVTVLTDDGEGKASFTVADATSTVDVQIGSALPEATIQTQKEAPSGSDIEVTWTGPDGGGDYITIVEVGAPDGAFGNYTYTNRGSPLTVAAPIALGAFEVRYMWAEAERTLASQTVTLTPIEATLDAPPEIPSGSNVQVTWTGPDYRQDYITIVEAGAPEGTYTNYTYTNRGSPLTLTVPDTLGAYEIRYVLNQTDATLASLPVTLVPVEGSVEAPAEIPAGSQFEVTWTGPDNNQDYITIVEAGAPEGSYTNYQRTNRGSPLTLTAPDGLGAYEVRYVINQSGRTLASQAVTLVDSTATIDAPAEIPSGSQFEVNWTGPDNNQDYLTIVEAGAPEGSYTNYQRTNRGSPLTLTAPDGLGQYEVRYVLNESGRTLASQTVTLVPVEASVQAPAEIPAGATFDVTWSGPDNNSDYITIVEAGAPEGSYLNNKRTNHGSPLQLIAPDALGSYEIRYVLGASNRTIASQPVTLVPVEATLEVLNAIVPGGEVQIAWTGPGYVRDYITIVEAGAPEGHTLDYQRTSRGNPMVLTAPESLGNFEIRYVLGDSNRTLASLPITIAPASVTLEAPKSVPVNSAFDVTWTGPGNWEDFIEIAPAGSPDDAQPAREARTSQGNPLPIFAPAQAGSYEIRYKMRDTGEVAARIDLVVE